MKFVFSIVVSILINNAYTLPIKEPPNGPVANATSTSLIADKLIENTMGEISSSTISLLSQPKDTNFTTTVASPNSSVSSAIALPAVDAPKPEAMAISQNEKPISSTVQVDSKSQGGQESEASSTSTASDTTAESKINKQADSSEESKESIDEQKAKIVSDERNPTKPQEITIITSKSEESTTKSCPETTTANVDHQENPKLA